MSICMVPDVCVYFTWEKKTIVELFNATIASDHSLQDMGLLNSQDAASGY